MPDEPTTTKTTKTELCVLCQLPWDEHKIHTEVKMINSKVKVIPTGWDCPK